jgi:protease PrsW
MTATTLGYAFIGGLLPSFIWLYFLLQEEAQHPEPKRIIALAFIAGMAAVPLALPLEQYARTALVDGSPVLLAWALVEEMLKYIMAASFILYRRYVYDTPDYVIYMITVALGFAAAENMLFFLDPLTKGQFGTALITGDLRFLGSTLLHVIASASLGLTFAFSAKFSPPARTLASAFGLILAVTLHTAFNMLIIKQGTSSALTAFFLVWTGAVILFAAFEVLKYLQSRDFPNTTP